MKLYTLGFAMTPNRHLVALIRKAKKPVEHVGKLNGIGGSLEGTEFVEECMAREFKEEAGVETNPEDWENLGMLRFRGGAIYLLRTFLDYCSLTSNPEEGEVGWYPMLPVPYDAVDNLRWILPFVSADIRLATIEATLGTPRQLTELGLLLPRDIEHGQEV